MKERVGESDVRREPGQLKTGGEGFTEHGSGAPRVRATQRAAYPALRVKARIDSGEQGWYRASSAPREIEGRFL